MKTKIKKFALLVALLTLVLPGIVSAAEIAGNLTVKVNGQVVNGGDILSVSPDSTLIVETVFVGASDNSEVRVKTWVEGYKNDIYKESEIFDVISAKKYVKWLSLKLPSDMDATDEYNLIVRVANRDNSDQEEYTLTIQRDSYKLEILSMDYVKEVESGKSLAVSVVVKNMGAHKIEDAYLTVAIPQLGVQKRVYIGDLYTSDDDEEQDAVEKTVVLTIPTSAKSGDYTLEAKVSNNGEEDKTIDTVTVKGTSATGEASNLEVVTSQLTKEVSIGGTQIYRIEIVNPTDEVKVITIGTPASLESQGITVRATPSVVKVQPNSAQTVEVTVETSNGTTVGQYNLPVKISEGTGSDQVVAKQVGITANVVKSTAAKTGSKIAISTVILAIIFVVLLIVLFVSLGSRKEAVPATGSEETAYY